MKKENIFSIILGIATTLFILMIFLQPLPPPTQKTSSIRQQQTSPASGEEQQEQIPDTSTPAPASQYLKVKGSYSLSYENL
jgi:hypothetical protein